MTLTSTGDVEQRRTAVLDDQQQGNVVANVGHDVHQHLADTTRSDWRTNSGPSSTPSTAACRSIASTYRDPNFTALVTHARVVAEQATSAEPQLFGDFAQGDVVVTTEA